MKYRIVVAVALILGTACTKTPDYATPQELSPMVLNEICPVWNSPDKAWVELANTSSSDVNVNGLQIQVSDDYYYRFKIFQFPEQTVAAGERFVLDLAEYILDCNTLEEVVLASADGTVISSIDIKGIGVPETGGSWSRIPDISGEFIATETATKSEPNYKYVPYVIDGVIINEIGAKEGWIELVYDVIRGEVILDETTIVCKDASGNEKTVYTFGHKSAEAGEKVVVDAQLGAFESVSIVSNEKKTVSVFNLSDLKDNIGADAVSYARIPDLKGEWHCCYSSTKGTANKDESADDSVLRINEVNLSEGWVEIYNPTVRTVKSSSSKISDGSNTVPVSGEYGPGEFKVFGMKATPSSQIILNGSNGGRADEFSAAIVKDQEIPQQGSWSRIPDGSDWYTVKTSSRGEKNYGVTKYNTVGIWYRQSSTPSLEKNMLDYVKNGIGHIFLHEYAFKYYEEMIPSILAKAREYGIKIHIWMQCFWWNDGKGVNGWRSPVDDANHCYDQALFDDILGAERAEKYVKAGVDGIHFDYIRFGGTSSKHDFPEYGISGVGSINEFLRQADERLRGINPDLIMSAALMGETGSEKAYGQHPEDMAQYLDILIPMLYRYGKWNRPTMAGKGEWFAKHGQPAQCWAGIQTYDENSYSLSSEDIRLDAEAFEGRGVKGVCLFREGLGQIPDLRHIKYNE